MYALLTSRAIVGEIYNRLTAGGDAWAMRYFMKITSRQAIETYGWLGMVPAMREWIGGRDPKKLREFTWAVANKDFEGTLEVLVSELRRDASGQLMIRIAEFARRALSHPTKLMTQKIIDAEATACYDGSYFFHTRPTPRATRAAGTTTRPAPRRPARPRPCRRCATPSSARSRRSWASRTTRGSR